jgi:Peptidase family M23
MSRHRTTAAALLVLLAAWACAGTAGGAVPRLVFPVVASTHYTDDFGAPRPSGGHQGNDIMAAKRSPVVAVEAGRVVKYGRSSNAGCMLYLHGRSGTMYMYIHLNNDRTMRNDNRGGCRNRIAYAPGLKSGDRVGAGELIAYVGDSGDANGIASHLHFELHPNGGRAVSPYKWLRRARKHLYARPAGGVYEAMRVRILGRVRHTALNLDPPRVRLRVTHVRLSNGWTARPARDVSVSVPPEAVMRRAVSPQTYEAITLDQLRRDDRLTAWTNRFPEKVVWARAPWGLHSVRTVLLRLAR